MATLTTAASNPQGGNTFAEIAFREHPVAQDGMFEVRPREWASRLFQPSQLSAERIHAESFEERLVWFEHELAKLRKQYSPYLRSLAPVAADQRQRVELSQFDFCYAEGTNEEFTRVLQGGGEWEQVTVPDFRGPTKEAGRWTGYYRTTFAYAQQPQQGRKVFLVFKGVDYEAAVYVNGKCVGTHEGMFAPFEFDITSQLRDSNVLVVEVKNDYPMMGVNGTRLDGDKMYAATGLGWDDPVYGWHHCPPGAGIYNKVYLEERAELFVEDIFVSPKPDAGCFELWVDTMNTQAGLIEGLEIKAEVYAENFDGDGLAELQLPIQYAGPGMNNYRYQIDFADARLWEPEDPCLYRVRVSLWHDGQLLDVLDRCFGMRSFRMDESTEPKGSLYLNNRPIILRGANEMGHLQQCVLQGNEAQLIDDILIAKLANMNYYRITQRPVQEEIYDMMDRLGMMNQCDLPAFSYIRRSKFNEAVRQAGEMERLVRSHPSVIMVSLINEPSRASKRGKGHRHLHRDELEALFLSARQAIYIENPDRVVKNVEGDYEPPTKMGLSDFHCYTMWYTNHMIAFGEFYKGGIPPIKKGWKTGYGEYGSEALDHLALMQERYPKEWLPARLEDPWMPDSIIESQTYSLHGDWYSEADHIEEWIARSQQYQAFVTRLMTDAIRRRSDLIIQSAIHLLIDAWPSGWMKSLVGVDRVPKPAYFSYRDSLLPLRAHLRGDRWRAYSGEQIELEAWLLNDTSIDQQDLRIVVTLRDEVQDYASYELEAGIAAVDSAYVGTIPLAMPQVDGRKTLHADISLYNQAGAPVNSERFDIEVFGKQVLFNEALAGHNIATLGSMAEQLTASVGLASHKYEAGSAFDLIVLSSVEELAPFEAEIAAGLKRGAKAILLPDSMNREAEWTIAGQQIQQKRVSNLYTLAFDQEDARFEGSDAYDYQFFYNRDIDRMEALTSSGWYGESLDPLLYTYAKPASGTTSQGARKRRIPVVGTLQMGAGEIILVGLRLVGKVGCNPPLDDLLYQLILNGSSR